MHVDHRKKQVIYVTMYDLIKIFDEADTSILHCEIIVSLLQFLIVFYFQ